MTIIDEEEFRKFLMDTKRTGPKPKSQMDHIHLLEEFLLNERDGRSLEEAAQEDLKAFAVWEKYSRPTTAQALVHGIRNYYRFLSTTCALMRYEETCDNASFWK